MTEPLTIETSAESLSAYRAVIENRDARSRIVFVCEHASCTIPDRWGDLGLDQKARNAHIAWDIGALELARAMSTAMGSCLVYAPVSRLVYDLNRAPNQDGAMPSKSEIFDIPGNIGISPSERAERTRAIYVPFHDDLHTEIARRIAIGLAPIIVTVHSFTPVWHGQKREVEFGVIHDADARLATAVLNHAPKGLVSRMNEPYSAMDGVTHTLRLQAGPYRLPNVMLELRNDLLNAPKAINAIAEQLISCLTAAVADISEASA